VQVGDAVALEHAGVLELDVLWSEIVEEPAPLAEEHGNEMDLELVQQAAASASCAVAAPWTSTFRSPAARLASVIAMVTSLT